MLAMPEVMSRPKGNEKRLVVYVSQEIFDELDALATKEDRSISNYTRNLILQALEKLRGGKND
ncbi:hypothetical protein HUN01_28655 [Nostoc edaphicum CCNP1411]|uniref:Uncharacterized protein n=1 Tax=Nostoc edaphicum CCNP1411 TaxID=1472755 RepID=A0A7D7LE80_9NOSO|nr:hypothetical protein [Nostoc edaphicum]QMS91376.1 hypothetical protein HUN01_28655 [Nostoc edaphicum CCNP1411]